LATPAAPAPGAWSNSKSTSTSAAPARSISASPCEAPRDAPVPQRVYGNMPEIEGCPVASEARHRAAFNFGDNIIKVCTMTNEVRRGTLLSFDSSAWTALVLLDGADTEAQLPVAQWIPSAMLTADSELAVLVFGGTDTDDGLVLGPYGAAGLWNYPALAGLTTGQVRSIGTGNMSALHLP